MEVHVETLSVLQASIVLALTLTDCIIMGAYVGERGEAVKNYGRTFKLHVYGGLSCVGFGALALLFFSLGMTTLGSVAAVIQGLSILALAAPAAFPLARYTSGLKGFNMLGYMGYTLAWLYSGLCLLWLPSLKTVYAAYILTHAFLTCRLFVKGFEWAYTRWAGKAPDASWNYSIATSVAAFLPMALAWGATGAAYFLSVWVVSILAHAFANASRWHKLYKPEDQPMQPMEYIASHSNLELVAVNSPHQ